MGGRGGGGYEYAENIGGGAEVMNTLKIWEGGMSTQKIWGGGGYEHVEHKGGYE